MKKNIFSIAVFCSMITMTWGQVGIGTATPRGALDINKPTTNTFGLVLPTNSETGNIINPQGGNVAAGTIIYDSSQNCIRLYRTSGWSQCLSDAAERPEVARVASWSTFSIGSSNLSTFNSQLNSANNYSAFGTYKDVSGFEFTTITSSLASTSVESLLANFDIISTGTGANMNANDAAKIKEYVDRGGIAIIMLDNTIGTNLLQAFEGTGTVTTGTINGRSTTDNINNGIFVDARDVVLAGVPGSGRIQTSQLPTGSKLLASEGGTNAGVWISGANGRAIFVWDEGVFRASDVEGTAIDTNQEKFLHNIMAYALNKIGS